MKNARRSPGGLVDSYFARFKGVVSSNRPIGDADAMAAVSDGRVFTGEQAVALHLADQVGRLDDAVNLARQMSNSPGGSGRHVQAPLRLFRIDLRRDRCGPTQRLGHDIGLTQFGDHDPRRVLLFVDAVIRITCTHCRQILTIDDGFAGGVCRCQHCGTIQTVPAALGKSQDRGATPAAKTLYPRPIAPPHSG